MQQKIIFEKEKTNPDEVITDKTPRQRFQRDFIKKLEEKINTGHEVIVFADFNDTMGANHSIVDKIILDTGMRDVWDHLHPGKTAPSTYSRGRNCLDYCLATIGIIDTIKYMNYTNFQEISNSDHRGIIIDIDNKALFQRTPTTEYHDRQLFSNDRKQVQQYLQSVQAHLLSNNVYELMTQLQRQSGFNASELEKIDTLVTEACISAEKKLRTRRRPWWSKKINKCRHQLLLLRNHHSRLKQGFKDSPQVQFQLDSNGFNHTLASTITLSSVDLQQAKDDLRDVIDHSREAREEEQLARYDYLNRNGQKDKASVIRAIKEKEKLADAYRQIKYLRNPLALQNLNKVDVPTQWTEQQDLNLDNMADPKTTTNWTTITNPGDIERYLILRNSKHFNQSHGTPLTHKAWTDLLNWAADSDVAQQITAGVFGTDHLETTHAAVIKACQLRLPELLVEAELTLETFQGKLRNWRESTATSPSGRHLGHYRSLITSATTIDNEEERKEMIQLQENIRQLIVNIINYTVKHRYSLKRWHRIESTMIPKDKNSVKIHRLRVIHIFEADYNLLLGVKWRELMLQLENTTEIHPDQHGSRPGRSATVLPFQEELCYDICRSSRTSLGNFDNDATACYDRVIAELASLAGLKHGMHRNLISVNVRTLEQARYYIRSSSQKNQQYYQHSENHPIYGTGQGCANSPTVWCTVSSILFDAHNQVSSGSSFHNPDLTVNTRFTMVGFVDDSTCRVNDFMARPQPNAFQLTGKITNDAQHWHDILWFSGGKLELAKCSYHFVSWGFKPNGEPFQIEHQNLPKICLRTPDGHQINIQRKSVFDPHKTLGHFKAPCSTLKVQLSKVKEKAHEVALAIQKSSLSKATVWTMYNSIYLSSVSYVLPQSNFKPQDLDEAQKESMSKIFAKCGYNHNSNQEILYGPSYLGGAGFIPWSTLQGEGQVINFLQHWRDRSKTTNLLKISLAWAQFQAGISQPILMDVDQPLPNVEAKWIISLRQFLSKADAQLELDTDFCYPAQRKGDRHLMDIAYQSGHFTLKEIKQINYCRLYLQVTTVSDIVNLEGNAFQPGAYTGQRELLISSAKELQAIQNKPDYTSWTLWIRLLKMVGTQSGNIHQPLGSWLYPGNKLKRIWKSYYNAKSKTYHQQGSHNVWTEFTKVNGAWQKIQLTHWRPGPDDIPRFFRGAFQPLSSPVDSRQLSFEEYMRLYDTNKILHQVDLKHDPFTIVDYITSTEAETYIVSDGSSRTSAMSQGWVLGTPTHGILAEGSGSAYGRPTSHRAESHGMHAATLFLRLLQSYTNTSLSSIVIQCDNSGLVTTIQQNQTYNHIFPTQFLKPDRDQIDAILYQLKSLQDPIIEHIKGHQDELSSKLTFPAKLNVRADELAGKFDSENPRRHFRAPVTSCAKVHLHIRNKTVTSNYRQHLREAVHGPAYRQYLCQLHQWGDSEASLIDWHQFSSLNHSLRHLRVWKAKYINNLLPTVRREKTWSYNRPPCQLCGVGTETWQHILQCSSPGRRKRTRQFLRRLGTTLEELDTAPELHMAIIDGLKSWFTQSPIEEVFQTDIQLEQDRLGWFAFLKGLWSYKWASAQHEYLCQHNLSSRYTTGHTWMRSVQRHLFEAMHSMWIDHTSSIHRPNDSSTATHFRLCQRIRQLQEEHKSLCPRDDHRFHLTEDQFAAYTETKLYNWINLFEDLILHQMKLRRHANHLNQSLLTDFFRPPVSTGV